MAKTEISDHNIQNAIKYKWRESNKLAEFSGKTPNHGKVYFNSGIQAVILGLAVSKYETPSQQANNAAETAHQNHQVMNRLTPA